MPSEVAVYLSIGAALWLAAELSCDVSRKYIAHWSGKSDPMCLRASIVIGTIGFIALWPFCVGYALVSLISAPVER